MKLEQQLQEQGAEWESERGQDMEQGQTSAKGQDMEQGLRAALALGLTLEKE